jgi:uncharacterized UPF0160 family protein
MKKLVTHGNGFHADDVTAYAILKEVLTKRGETWEIARSRDPEIIATGDIVFDIGDIYDPATNRYDHHQRGKAGTRENGIYYAAAGLIWKHFGMELCSNETVWSQIDKGIISELDAIDNGQNYIGELLFKNTGYSSLGMHIANFETLSFDDASNPDQLLQEFEQASEFMRGIISRAIVACERLEQAFQDATRTYQNSSDKQIIIFDKNYARPIWKRLAEYPEPIFAVYYKKASDSWKVEAVPVMPTVMNSRKLAPDAWRGLNGEALQQASGISDATFCHSSGFLFGAVSLESALKMAHIALES